MESLLSHFPANNFSLLGVILAFPLLGAFVNGIWGKRLGKEGVRLMALSAIGVSFIASVVSFLSLKTLAGHGGGEHAEHVKLKWTVWSWMHTTQNDTTTIPIDVTFSVDALSGVMMLVITGVGFLIHLYATSYMEKDPAYWRFFSYLNLFVFSMLTLVMGDNLPILFVGWEGVGLCSYLLIGFWYKDNANASAGKKAFIANRIGDFGLICGMFLLAHYCGALDWDGLSANASKLVTPGAYAGNKDYWDIGVWPLAHSRYEGTLGFLQPGTSKLFEYLHLAKVDPAHPIPITLTILPATAIGLALLLGCTGKSAQIPLYVWLPDAMAGPTPVSALIHAATMVTAGIYLCCRMWFIFALSPFVMVLIAFIGVTTALLAASIALVQNDIKKVLAYSTVSQLGFMFVGVGVGAFTAGFFHVLTHAFFKACLFLGAGSVIHAMHARIHDGDASQDMRNMGGLKKYMPVTYWTFLAATLAIIGLPGTSGFFSKDEILFRAFSSHTVHPLATQAAAIHAWQAPEWTGKVIYGLGVIAALMTAFYMVRLFLLTFHGDFRGWKIGEGNKASAHADTHADDHHDNLQTPGAAPHESPWQMTLPLIILGTLALFAGFLNPGFHIFEHPPLEHWLDPVFDMKHVFSGVKPQVEAHSASLEWMTAIGGVGAFVVGSGLAYWVYALQGGAPAKSLATAMPRLHRILLNKWYVDEAYNATAIEAVDALADTSANVIDPWIVDGILAKLTSFLTSAAGTLLRAFQNGVMHLYAALIVVGIAVCGWFFVMPHAHATFEIKGNSAIVTAAPGPGYRYRWVEAGGKERPFTERPATDIPLEAGASKDITLEVTNAFGHPWFIAKKVVRVSRPANTDLKVGQK